jgi:hypothetical protein
MVEFWGIIYPIEFLAIIESCSEIVVVTQNYS